MNSCPTKPAGVQASSPIVPPGRQTRTSSSAARWWCGANITPTQDRTTSNEPSSWGSASAINVGTTRLLGGDLVGNRAQAAAAAQRWRPGSDV